ECLTGTRPYDGDNLISIALKVHGGPVPKLPTALALPTELDAWLARALAKDPERRFQSARELVDALRRACLLDSSSSSSANSRQSTPELASAAQPQAGARGQTVPLQRAALKAPTAEATAASANVQSAQPTTRHVDVQLRAEGNSRKKRPFAWALGVLLVGALLALLGATLRRSKSTAVEDRADAAHALPRVAQSPEASATAATPALVPSASASIVSEPTTFASAEPQKVVPKADAAPSASGPKATAAPLPGLPSMRKPPGPAASGKPLDIERKPTF
ncbi:MAG TPA: hypothetical protein VJV79_23980, partial [Polyangiaceae bacterium]|nr:hypothetical protein [Polyangiaceae bacterium]